MPGFHSNRNFDLFIIQFSWKAKWKNMYCTNPMMYFVLEDNFDVTFSILSHDYIWHYEILDSYFFQATSISYSGFPWVSGSPGASTELNFRGSGCDHKVLGVLESKNLKTRPNLTKKSQFSNNFWLLAPPKPQGRTQKP